MNIMSVEGYQAKIAYDAELDMFRGAILGQRYPLRSELLVPHSWTQRCQSLRAVDSSVSDR